MPLRLPLSLNRPRCTLVASPSLAAIGGVAAHTAAIVGAMPEAHAFDQWWPLTARGSNRWMRLLVHILGLARWVAALVLRRPDVVHLQVTQPGLPRDILYLHTARALGARVVAHLHTSGFTGPAVPSAIQSRVSTVLEGADAVIVMSPIAAQEFQRQYGVPKSRIHVVANPAPEMPMRVDRPDGEPCRFVCVGEISELKGQSHLGRAADALAQDGVEVEVVLVGPEGVLAEPEMVLLRANPRVVFRGVRRGLDLATEYMDADVFVLFSFTEAEPMAMLEAMGAGLPVVATSIGSIPSTLAAVGEGNRIVAPGDDAALLDAMRALAMNPQLCRQVGSSNREWVRSTRSVALHVDALRAVHERVAGSTRSTKKPDQQ